MIRKRMSTSHLSWGCLAIVAAVLLAALRGHAVGVAADEPALAAKDAVPPDLALVPRDALGFISIRLGDLCDGELGKALGQELSQVEQDFALALGLKPADVERLTAFMSEPNQPLLVVYTRKPYTKAKVLRAATPQAKQETQAGRTYYAADKTALYFIDDKTFVFGTPESVLKFLKIPVQGKVGPLSAALNVAAQHHHVVVGVNPAVLVRLFPAELPPEFGPLKPFLKAETATLIVSFGPEVKEDLRVTFSTQDAAKDGEKAAQAWLALGQQSSAQVRQTLGTDETALRDLLKASEAALKDATVRRDGTTVLMSLSMKTNVATVAAVLAESIARVRLAALRLKSANTLKQLALAMYAYESVHGRLPAAAIHGKDGKPLLSWRVAILPYIIGEDKLYEQFHLDEPWDSPHNKKLLAQMPKAYAPVRGQTKEPYTTFYQVFVGPGAAFEGEKGLPLAEFTDGTSNTLLIVEAGEPVPWTKPIDLTFDPKKPLPKLGGLFPDLFNACFADGSVRPLRTNLAEKALRALITRNGGELVDPDKP